MTGALPGTSTGPDPGRNGQERSLSPARRTGGRDTDGTRRGEKSPQAFRTISEVAQDLEVPPHVLRFWETKFSQVRPLKRGGGRRYYRPEDVDLLRRIRALLYREGYTIKGVQRVLREGGSQVAEAAPGRAGTALEGDPAPTGDAGDGGAAVAVAVQAAGQDLPVADPVGAGGLQEAVVPGADAVPGPARAAGHPPMGGDSDQPRPAAAMSADVQAPGRAVAPPPVAAGPSGPVGAIAAAGPVDMPDRADAAVATQDAGTRLAARDAQWRQRLAKVLLDLRTVREVLQRELQAPS